MAYDIYNNINLFCNFFVMKNSIGGCYVGTVEEYDPLAGILLKSKLKGMSLGVKMKKEINLPLICFLGELVVTPIIKYYHQYENPSYFLRTKRLLGWGGYLQAGIGFNLGSFSLRCSYQPELY